MIHSIDKPRVSVVMPAHNVDAYVTRAIESLQRQTMEDFELLVVDDGSTDHTGDILDRPTATCGSMSFIVPRSAPPRRAIWRSPARAATT